MAVKLGYPNVYRDPYGFPKWQAQGLPTAQSPAGLAAPPQTAAQTVPAQSLRGWAMLWTLLGVFAGGLALNLTPCVYPMIPITVSFFGGRTAHDRPGQVTLVLHGLCYLMGLALTNASLGVAAALSGGLMGALLQHPLVLALVAGVLILFATSLFGLWELRLPGAMAQAAAKTYSGYFGSLFMGLTLGVVAAPCIGPFVLGLLTWVATMGNPWLGFLIFFTLSMGLGLPLFVLALFSGQLQRLPRAGGWMLWVRKLMGWVLVAMAVYFTRPVLPEILKVLLPVGVALAAGLHLGWIDQNQAGFKAFPWLKSLVATACLVLAAFWLTTWTLRGPGVSWQPYAEETLSRAAAQKKPVIIDFYADWCAPCRELDEKTFSDPAVRSLLESYARFKVDLTKSTDANQELVANYGVLGVPTVIVLAGGEEVFRITGFEPPEQFLKRLESVP